LDDKVYEKLRAKLFKDTGPAKGKFGQDVSLVGLPTYNFLFNPKYMVMFQYLEFVQGDRKWKSDKEIIEDIKNADSTKPITLVDTSFFVKWAVLKSNPINCIDMLSHAK
jgi:hypothetical protein